MKRFARDPYRWIELRNLCLAVAILLPLAVAGLPAHATCSGNSPAFPVPEFRDGVRLWPSILRPGLPDQQLPANRDSTDYTFGTVPSQELGHELFQSLDIVEDRLYVAYGLGLQVWDIGPGREEQPLQLDYADGPQEDFLLFGHLGEVDTYIFDVAAQREPSGSRDLLAVAADVPVGVSLWTNQPGVDQLTQVYQDRGARSRLVQLLESGGKTYALAAINTSEGGVAVYDVDRALELGSCLDDSSLPTPPCSGVYLGKLGNKAELVRYLAVLQRGGDTFVAISDGSAVTSRPLRMEVWRLDDPASPATAELGVAVSDPAPNITDIRGVEMFSWRGSSWLAYIEDFQLKIFNVDSCLDLDGCTSLPPATITRPVANRPAEAHLLTFTMSNGRPFLYYSVMTDRLSGGAVELLLDVSKLGEANPLLTAVTAGGETYVDTCTGADVGYWADYYPLNEHGLASMVPNRGRFAGEYFYRAGRTILDVHVLTEAIFADGFESGGTGEWTFTNG